MADRPVRQPAFDAAEKLHRSAIHLLRRVRQEDAASGLTPPRASALSVLVFGGPMTLGELARAEQVRPPTITRLVQDMAREGLVTIDADPADRRIKRVAATPHGRKLMLAGKSRRVHRIAVAVAALPRAERALLERALDIVAKLGATV